MSEATGAGIEALGTERGHRTLAITREGGKNAVIPLAPRTARAIDLAIGERCEGPIFRTPAGQRLDRHAAGRVVRRVAGRSGLASTYDIDLTIAVRLVSPDRRYTGDSADDILNGDLDASERSTAQLPFSAAIG